MNHYYMDFDPHVIRQRIEERLAEVRSVQLEVALRHNKDGKQKKEKMMGNMASIKEGALNLRCVVLLLTTMGVALLLASGVAYAAPANDYFADAQQITGIYVDRESRDLIGTNVGATKERGEPNISSYAAEKSVWYYWTAQESGPVTINAFGRYGFDPLLGVYTGNAVNALTEVASDGGDYHAEVIFRATAGTTYRIAVDGFAGSPYDGSGTFSLALNAIPPPANDRFANARQITGANASLTGYSMGAMREGLEPNHAGVLGYRSVWYYWTPQGSGTATIDTFGSKDPSPVGRDLDTLLGVYTGSAVNALTEVASNNDAGDGVQSQVSFPATAGTTYRIAVDSYNFSGGNIKLRLASDTAPPDTTAPNPPVITGPANNSFDTDGTITLSGTAEANSTVELFEGANPIGSAVAASSGGYTLGSAVADASGGWYIKLRDISEGSHSYTAKATDQEANTSAESEARTVIVDATAPDAPSITSPVEGSLNPGSFTISGSAEAGAKVELFESGVSKGEATAGSEGDWSIPLSGVSEGSHSYKAKATDKAGNTSVESESRTVVVDATAPAAPRINNPANDSFDTDGTITLSGTAEEGTTLEVFELTASGPTSMSTAPVDSSGAWSKTLSGMPDGSHTYTVKATDAAGNTSAESEGRTVIVDTIAPTVRRVVPQKDATGIAPGANVSALFSEAMRATSVKGAFKLYKKGSTTALTATLLFDAATKKAVLDPSANLQRGATYKAVITTGAKDLAGNSLSQPKVWFFTVSP